MSGTTEKAGNLPTLSTKWQCASGHLNEIFTNECPSCDDVRPCKRCGTRPTRMYAAGALCETCVDAARLPRSTWKPAVVELVPEVPPTIIEAQRLAEPGEIPKFLKSLIVWCNDHAITHRETYARTTEHESVLFVAHLNCVPWRRRTVMALYLDGGFTTGLISGGGTARFRDIRVALGQNVPPPTPRKKKVEA
jgi:hypothetical protein